MESRGAKKVNIYEYDNYRTFLKDLYTTSKEGGRPFSFRYFSRQAGFRSPNFLQLVMEGKRNLTAESIEKFARALKLNKDETSFFRNLVLLNQATTVDEKKFYAEQLIRSRFYRKVYPLKQAEYDYYSKWYYVPIRELVGLEGFINDPEWIARQLTPPITTADAAKALEELEKLGLLRKIDDGRLVQTEKFVSTGDEVASNSVAQFHKEMMQKGSESIDLFSAIDREISSSTLGLSEENANQVKELIQRFRRELLAIASQDKNPTRVYQINFQLFPITEKTMGEKKS